MENALGSLINKIISDNDITSKEDLSLFLSENPAVILQLELAASANRWVYFTEETYDGWYCLRSRTSSTKLDVYYKERGTIAWGVTSYENRSEAVVSVLVESGYVSF